MRDELGTTSELIDLVQRLGRPRVAVIGDWGYAKTNDLSGLYKDDVHLLLTGGDNVPSLHEKGIEGRKAFSEAVLGRCPLGELALDDGEHVNRDPVVVRTARIGIPWPRSRHELAHAFKKLGGCGRAEEVERLIVSGRLGHMGQPTCPWFDKVEQIPLLLGRTATYRRELHRS